MLRPVVCTPTVYYAALLKKPAMLLPVVYTPTAVTLDVDAVPSCQRGSTEAVTLDHALGDDACPVAHVQLVLGASPRPRLAPRLPLLVT